MRRLEAEGECETIALLLTYFPILIVHVILRLYSYLWLKYLSRNKHVVLASDSIGTGTKKSLGTIKTQLLHFRGSGARFAGITVLYKAESDGGSYRTTS